MYDTSRSKDRQRTSLVRFKYTPRGSDVTVNETDLENRSVGVILLYTNDDLEYSYACDWIM